MLSISCPGVLLVCCLFSCPIYSLYHQAGCFHWSVVCFHVLSILSIIRLGVSTGLLSVFMSYLFSLSSGWVFPLVCCLFSCPVYSLYQLSWCPFCFSCLSWSLINLSPVLGSPLFRHVCPGASTVLIVTCPGDGIKESVGLSATRLFVMCLLSHLPIGSHVVTARPVPCAGVGGPGLFTAVLCLTP